jgi:hypothetical protein
MLMALTGDVDYPSVGKCVRPANGLTKAAQLLCAYNNRVFKYVFNL